jgi:hypothetical protein
MKVHTKHMYDRGDLYRALITYLKVTVMAQFDREPQPATSQYPTYTTHIHRSDYSCRGKAAGP